VNTFLRSCHLIDIIFVNRRIKRAGTPVFIPEAERMGSEMSFFAADPADLRLKPAECTQAPVNLYKPPLLRSYIAKENIKPDFQQKMRVNHKS